MTSPSGMSCETCRDLLIELVCDELAAETAAAVRAHALKCERCGPELQKLSFTLEASSSLGLLTPSPEVEHRIMQAAREAIAGRARGPAREASSGASIGITEWFARLGSFAMSPQVAMASVLLLVVGIGLYALPFGRDAEPTALRATEEEADEHGPAPAPPAASAAAAPMADESRDDRERPGRAMGAAASRAEGKARDRSLADQELAKGARMQKDLESLGSARGGAGRLDTLSSKESRAVDAFPGAKAGSGGAAPSASAKPKSHAKDEPYDGDFAPSPSKRAELAAPAAAPRKMEAEKSAQPDGNRVSPSAEGAASTLINGAKAPKAASAPAPAQAPVQAERAAEPVAASADKRAQSEPASALEQGILAIKRGEHAKGEALLKPIASSGTGAERSAAMLWLARSLRERGDCTGALNFYRPLTQPVTATRAVLEEAADCQARTGNATAAERLRARAALPTKQ